MVESTVLDDNDNEDEPNLDDDDANRCWALLDLLRIVAAVATKSWRVWAPPDLMGSTTNPGDGYDKEEADAKKARDDDAAATAAVRRKSVVIMQLMIATMVPALSPHLNGSPMPKNE